MPGRLAELALVSARLRATMEKDANLLGAAIRNPGKAALAVGGTALAGSAGLNKKRDAQAGFQPPIRDAAMGLTGSNT